MNEEVVSRAYCFPRKLLTDFQSHYVNYCSSPSMCDTLLHIACSPAVKTERQIPWDASAISCWVEGVLFFNTRQADKVHTQIARIVHSFTLKIVPDSCKSVFKCSTIELLKLSVWFISFYTAPSMIYTCFDYSSDTICFKRGELTFLHTVPTPFQHSCCSIIFYNLEYMLRLFSKHNNILELFN